MLTTKSGINQTTDKNHLRKDIYFLRHTEERSNISYEIRNRKYKKENIPIDCLFPSITKKIILDYLEHDL